MANAVCRLKSKRNQRDSKGGVLVTMQVGFDFAVGDKKIDFLLHRIVLKVKNRVMSSKIFF
jgi:hypothetical protein